jgi:hypothetical protein
VPDAPVVVVAGRPVVAPVRPPAPAAPLVGAGRLDVDPLLLLEGLGAVVLDAAGRRGAALVGAAGRVELGAEASGNSSRKPMLLPRSRHPRRPDRRMTSDYRPPADTRLCGTVRRPHVAFSLTL